jgi:hypothetical protein
MLRIVAESAVTIAEWGQWVQKTSYASFYHGPQWASLSQMMKHGSEIPDARRIEFDDGMRVLLPMTSRRLYGLASFSVMSAGGEYGGWLGEGPLSEEHHEAIWEWLKKRNFLLRQNPFYPKEFQVPRDVSIIESFTQAIRLEQPLTQHWRKGRKSDLSKALKSGVVVREAVGDADWKGFVETYHASANRWGSQSQTIYDDALFSYLQNVGLDNIKLWVALFESKVVAGALCLYQGRQITYWIGSLDADYASLRPVPLLLKTIMDRACDAGYEWFDFGPSGGLEGVESFKAGFGAINLPCHSYIYYVNPWLRRLKQCMSLARGMRK